MKIRGVFILSCLLLTASLAWGRGGGGCLEEGTLIATPTGPIPIERLERGDAVWSVVDGQLQPAAVEAKSQVDPTDYVEITAVGRTLRATAEHPVQIDPGLFGLRQIYSRAMRFACAREMILKPSRLTKSPA